MSRKKANPYKYLAVFAVTTLIFVAGIVVGNELNSMKMDQLTQTENKIRSSTLGMELEYLLRSERPCSVINSSRFTGELGDISNKLTYMENQLGKNNPRVINLKEYYSMLEIRHWMFLKNAREECDRNYSLVLYFYSNEEGECPDCEDQGHVLSYIHDKDSSFNIYSFDVNIENPALTALKDIYGIKTTPSLVVDGKLYEGFQGREKLIEALRVNESRFP